MNQIFKLTILASALFLTSTAQQATACVPCKERHHTECGPNPKRPNCHEVFTCEGGTCGHHDMFAAADTLLPAQPASAPLCLTLHSSNKWSPVIVLKMEHGQDGQDDVTLYSARGFRGKPLGTPSEWINLQSFTAVTKVNLESGAASYTKDQGSETLNATVLLAPAGSIYAKASIDVQLGGLSLNMKDASVYQFTEGCQ